MGRKKDTARSAWDAIQHLRTPHRADAAAPPSVEERLRAGALKGRRALLGTVLDLVIEAIEARDASSSSPRRPSRAEQKAEAEAIVERLRIGDGGRGTDEDKEARTGEELRALGRELGDLARSIGEVARAYAPDARRLGDVRAHMAEARRHLERLADERRDAESRHPKQ